MQKVHHGDMVKTYSIKICDGLLDKYYHCNKGEWLHEENLPDNYLDDEDFECIFVDIEQILSDLLDNIPGLQEVCYHSEYTLEINLRELHLSGWSESILCLFLEQLSEHVHNKLSFESEYTPTMIRNENCFAEQWKMVYGKFQIPKQIKDLMWYYQN